MADCSTAIQFEMDSGSEAGMTKTNNTPLLVLRHRLGRFVQADIKLRDDKGNQVCLS
jgi:hypothetical protein